MDLYDVLEIKKTASNLEIKKAYKRLSMLYHPDRNNGKTNPRFYIVSSAYEILTDPIKKVQYDSVGYINGNDMDADSRKDFNQNPFIDLNFDFSNIDPRIGQALQFVTAINSLCSKVFNSDTSIFDNLCEKIDIDNLIEKNEEEKAQNHLYKAINKHFNIALNNKSESEVQYESDFTQSSISEYKPSDIVINLDTNIKEIYEGKIKILTFERQCFKNKEMIIETRTINIPICNDKMILENEGNDYISDDGKMVRGRVIINIKCLHDKYYKRVNDYDILLLSHINESDIDKGINKKFKYFDSTVNIKSKNLRKKCENDKITFTMKNLGISYYENNNIKNLLRGDLIIIFFVKKDVEVKKDVD